MAPAWRRRSIGPLATALAACLACLLAATARADERAGRVYWVNNNTGTISYVSIDGSEGGAVGTGQAVVARPSGLAIDTATERIYWANQLAGERISFASLRGLGGGVLGTGDLTVSRPFGLAIDPLARRIYWLNQQESKTKLAFADLEGSGGGNLENRGSASFSSPDAVAIDPVGGRIYWSNQAGPDPVAFANLDGSGGASLNTTGASPNGGSAGVAVDATNQRAYWANFGGRKISFANLDGSGGGDLPTAGATVDLPLGVAVDPIGGRIYWANSTAATSPSPPGISFANLDGSGGGNLAIVGTSADEPMFPILYFAPHPVAPPKIDGGSTVGSVLSCPFGGWAPDAAESFLYQAPQSFAYQWSRNGTEIADATQSTIRTDAPGAYSCQVTARNLIGQATQTSAPFQVVPVPPARPRSPAGSGDSTQVTLGLVSRRLTRKGQLRVRIANADPFPVTGQLGGVGAKKKLRPKPFAIGASAEVVVKLRLPAPLLLLYRRGRDPSIVLEATVTDPSGGQRVVKAVVVPRTSP